jgi:hypothetical protein
MTQHELLSFIDGLRGFVERSAVDAGPGPWCWPTWELLLGNLEYNRVFWGPRWHNEFGDTIKTLRRKGWVAEGPCTLHCHARHVRITDEGFEALGVMNKQGCSGHMRVKRRSKCHAKFKFTPQAA